MPGGGHRLFRNSHIAALMLNISNGQDMEYTCLQRQSSVTSANVIAKENIHPCQTRVVLTRIESGVINAQNPGILGCLLSILLKVNTQVDPGNKV